MPRPQTQLSSASRRKIRGALGKLERAERDFYSAVGEALESGESQAAIARELGITRAALNERISRRKR